MNVRRILLAALAALLPLIAAACGFFPLSTHSRAGAEVLESAPKPAPVDSEFAGCGPEGSQPDYAINRLKNRIDEGLYLTVPWTLIARLPWPRSVGYRFRNQWTQGERDEVDRYEGVAVDVQGYVVDAKLEPPEPPNCYDTDPAHRDYHLWLADSPTDAKRRAFVVEITPRVRAKRAGWTDDRIRALVESRARVRVQGWLMLDQMHPESVGGTRITLWEVHPIMHLYWMREGRWTPLEDTLTGPTAPSRNSTLR